VKKKIRQKSFSYEIRMKILPSKEIGQKSHLMNFGRKSNKKKKFLLHEEFRSKICLRKKFGQKSAKVKIRLKIIFKKYSEVSVKNQLEMKQSKLFQISV
jgi:hypothetical protein